MTAQADLTYARRWKTLGVLSLALLVIGLDNTILNVALPSLQNEFDASTSTGPAGHAPGSPGAVRAASARAAR